MFKVKQERFGRFTAVRLRNDRTGEAVDIIPGFGANVRRVALALDGKVHELIDGERTDRSLVKNRWFKGAKLTPFPNRVKDGVYRFLRKECRLPINFPSQHHAIHGLVYDRPFRMLGKNATGRGAWVRLGISIARTAGYPFSIEVQVTYRLTARGFSCTTLAKNVGKENAPFGDGWHPYFKTGGKVDGLVLKTPAGRIIMVDERMIPDGRTSPYGPQETVIGKRKLDMGLHLEERRKGRASAEINDRRKGLRIVIWQETGKGKYGYLQVFTHPSRKSLAIEPMTCCADAFNSKEGLIVLKPGASFKASYGIFLKKSLLTSSASR